MANKDLTILLFFITFGIFMHNETKATTNDSVIYACAGGFTGGGNGVTVKKDGTIIQWTSNLNSQNKEVASQSDVTFTNKVFERIDDSHFMNINYNKPANMTCSLIINRSNYSHTVSWSGKPPEKIKLLVEFAHWLDAEVKQRMNLGNKL